MKVLVFGATGGTGVHVVQQALVKGFDVTAFARDPAKINVQHPGLAVVQGDVLRQSSIDAVMDKHDAVICCLGSPATKAGQLRSPRYTPRRRLPAWRPLPFYQTLS